MVKFSILSLVLLVLFHSCLARQELGSQFQNECQLDSLEALEPSEDIQCEAGRIQYWDHNHPQLRCAGVAVVRRIIEPNGLYLPTFHNAPQITYIVRGRGVTGRMMPGCPETYMDSQQFGERGQRGERGERGSRGEWGQQGQQFRDMHQKLDNARRGDVFAWPAGSAHWCYNTGDEPLVVLSLIDISNRDNQLDRNPRSFHLAGNNPQGRQFQTGQREGSRGRQQQQSNLLSGFDPQILAEAFKIDVNTAQRLQNQDDTRGNIVHVRGGLQVIRPPTRMESEEYSRGQYNGLEETLCTMKFHENIDDPSRADVFKPQLGRITNLNSLTLPVLRWVKLSATRGVIYRNALVLPKWNINSNEVLYCTGGQARIQVVNDNGQSVFDQELRQGQLLIIPQGYASVKRAEGERFEWISFKTNDNAKVNHLAGRISVMRAMPLEVLTNAFQISLDEARRIKFNTQETTLTHAGGSRMIQEKAEA